MKKPPARYFPLAGLRCRGSFSFSAEDGLQLPRPAPGSTYAALAGKGPPGQRFPWVNRIEEPVRAQAISIYNNAGLFSQTQAAIFGICCGITFISATSDFPVFDRVRRHYESAPPSARRSAWGVSSRPTGPVSASM